MAAVVDPASAAEPADEMEELMNFNSLFSLAPAPHPMKSPRKKAASAAAAAATTLASDLPVLELKHFAVGPTLSFGEVAPRASATRALVVQNDSSRAQRLEVCGIETKDALRTYPSAFEVAPNSQKEVSITWAPVADKAKLGKKIKFKWNDGCSSLEVTVKGVCSRTAAKQQQQQQQQTVAATPRVAAVKRMAAADAGVARAPLSPSTHNRVAPPPPRPRPLRRRRRPPRLRSRPISRPLWRSARRRATLGRRSQRRIRSWWRRRRPRAAPSPAAPSS